MHADSDDQSAPSSSTYRATPPVVVTPGSGADNDSTSLKRKITTSYNSITNLIALEEKVEKVKAEYNNFKSLVKKYRDREDTRPTGTTPKKDHVTEQEELCQNVVKRYLDRNENGISGTEAASSVMQVGTENAAGGQQCTSSVESIRNETPRKPNAKREFAKLRLNQLGRRQAVDKEIYNLNQRLELMEIENEIEFAKLEAELGQKKNE